MSGTTRTMSGTTKKAWKIKPHGFLSLKDLLEDCFPRWSGVFWLYKVIVPLFLQAILSRYVPLRVTILFKYLIPCVDVSGDRFPCQKLVLIVEHSDQG
ncbi:hypothetical protein BDV09DRAFT_165913 [Aspergillus tetrazonus]